MSRWDTDVDEYIRQLKAQNAALLEALEKALIVLEAPLDVFPRSYIRVMNDCKEVIRKAKEQR